MTTQPAAPAITPAAMRVIGRLDPPAFEIADFPGFSVEQVIASLTVLPVALTEEEAARICPVFRGPFITGSAS